ncbi:Di-trans-poly-cis-decaprenylcistransferase [Beutenbergia cavernae DSM 12333]|uniref:Isoprenyl transferase n=1 Tax=Beutenbergia cavernae (strain ATCC BAA-8 / DSM 12333 / CCUG 43141 / JCM 11478 / NBRC 16432 / NCIMB 13614 / HKI 0122) TaxID=471853 RepID=C5C3T5_BEUC1|nr:polyprenyl diphosphate synthase [Beutenbergia cavernae]ACQ81994.1 Di-trans-poly-cis-decaprenylcistransferase [Beutenbergia cavernae DSM 12333]
MNGPALPGAAFARRAAEGLAERRLERALAGAPVPRHVGLVMDGNRRWARLAGSLDPRVGHRAGAEHLSVVLGWCARAGIDRASVYVLSAANIAKRGPDEVAHLMTLLETTIARQRRDDAEWSLAVAGSLDLLPDRTAHALKEAIDATAGRPRSLTLAIGYDPHEEIAAAVRAHLADAADDAGRPGATLTDLARAFDADDLDARIPGGSDIDLVIRTSGERRLSGFFPWRSAGAELVFCDVYWPGFRRLDFLRALRTYAQRVGTR